MNSQNDLRANFVDWLDLDFPGNFSRPIRERHAVAISGLVQPDSSVGQIELDIETAEEVLAEDDSDAFAEVPFAGDE